jgi:aminopeptidase-like protein
MGLSFKIIEDLFLKNRNFCSEDYSECLNYIKEILPGRIITFDSSEEVNGWVIPPKWDLSDAYILKGGVKILDATQHVLQVIGLSLPFEGKVFGKELKKHLHYRTINNLEGDVIPFHFRQFYNSWKILY